MATIRLHRGDLPDISRYLSASSRAVAIDTETMGLDLDRDRLCVVQLSPGDGSADVVQIPPHARDAPDGAPNLKRLLADKNLLKIFHFARFDLGMLYKAFGVMPEPVYCTKIASRLVTDLYRQARTERSGARSAGPGSFQAAAVLRLGRRGTHRGAGILRRGRRHAPPCAQGQARCHAGARGPRSAGGAPASAFCRTGCGSTSPALPPTIFLPIPEPAIVNARR